MSGVDMSDAAMALASRYRAVAHLVESLTEVLDSRVDRMQWRAPTATDMRLRAADHRSKGVGVGVELIAMALALEISADISGEEP
ncbi:MAG: hypothetical protein GY724_01415 [Actinomycetia bacterium]|nr:hypothetical protein [Actinomycetes bacterium]MCP4224942.1 hypothetical protein [Actinomycetes bacterium]MCP5031639.1 hypothetical protein [Actinomycetes bacterium]